MARLSSHVLCLVELFLAMCMLPFPLVQWLSAPLWWIFNKGLLLSPSEELIKVIEARADEPHHPDLEALLSPPPDNYTCIIRTRMHADTHALTHSCMYTHVHFIETAHRYPNRSPRPIPTSPRDSESPRSNNDLNMHRGIITRGGYTVFVEEIFVFRLDNNSFVLCLCIRFFCSFCL